MKKLFFALLLLPFALAASPTRVLTLDNQQMLVTDDSDATIYYHLAPNFKDHFYVDVLNSGKTLGWAFLDVKVGTLVLWWNKDYNNKTVYDQLVSGNKLGYTYADLNSSTGNAYAPLERWIKAPEVKLSVGYALELGDSATLGLCFQYAGVNQTRDSASTDGEGNPLQTGSPLSLSRYLSTGTAGFYNNLTVTSYKNTQSSTGMSFAPSLGINASNFSIDAKAEAFENSLNNSHSEDVANAAGDRMGTVTQGLKDEGKLSWLAMGKFRMPFKSGNLIIRGGYRNFDFSTQHTQKGAFSGTGFATAQELAGFDHVDAEEILTQKIWDSMLGYTMDFNKSRGMLVLGLGLNGNSTHQEDILYGPRTGGGPIDYNALATQTRNVADSDLIAAPLLLGAEMEIAKFAKCSGVVSHNVYSSSTAKNVSETYSTGTGNPLQSRTTTQGVTDQTPSWTLGTGLGLYFGSFTWDMAVNTGLLASSGNIVNPAYQSSLGWGF